MIENSILKHHYLHIKHISNEDTLPLDKNYQFQITIKVETFFKSCAITKKLLGM